MVVLKSTNKSNFDHSFKFGEFKSIKASYAVLSTHVRLSWNRSVIPLKEF